MNAKQVALTVVPFTSATFFLTTKRGRGNCAILTFEPNEKTPQIGQEFIYESICTRHRLVVVGFLASGRLRRRGSFRVVAHRPRLVARILSTEPIPKKPEARPEER